MTKLFTISVLVASLIVSANIALADFGYTNIDDISYSNADAKPKSEIKVDIDNIQKYYQRRLNFNYYGVY